MKYLSLLASSLILVVSGCHDQDHSSTTTPASTPTSKKTTVTPSLGQISQAAVKATCTANNLVLGQAQLDANGSVSLNLNQNCSSPVLFELISQTNSQYYDEARLANTALPVDTTLRALVPSLSAVPAQLGLTALTEIATKQALAAAGTQPVTASQVNNANQKIVTQLFGAGVQLNILSKPTVWNAATTRLGTSDADVYAFYLAVIAQLAKNDSAPALKALQLLGTDLADGVLDGATDTAFSYSPTNLISLQTAALQQLAAFADTDLKAQLNIATDPVDPELPSCGTQATLSLADLTAYQGSYTVKILENSSTDPEAPTIEIKTTTLILDANGKISLDGQVANTIKVCANQNTVSNTTGVVAYLDRSDALGRSHVDFWSDQKVNGTDFTSATVFRYFNGQRQNTTPIDPTPVDPTPVNRSCEGNSNAYGCVTVDGLTSLKTFEHNYTAAQLKPVVIKNPIADAGTVTWANVGSTLLNSTTTNLTYTYSNVGQNFQSVRFGLIRYDDKGLAEQIVLDCGSAFASACTGASIDFSAKTLTLNNVVLTEFDPATQQLKARKITLSGQLKF